MLNRICISALLLCLVISIPLTGLSTDLPDARSIVKKSLNYVRGEASVSMLTMVIHRPQWERRMTIKAWTKGDRLSLFHTVAPAKDRGNGTLKKGREMWMFNPKINRVIKLPPSMMSQGWMGSDFSNNDLSKTDSILDEYTHRIIGTETRDGMTIYEIESIPKPDAPVIWGMQRLKIREDGIMVSQEFYDEDAALVKTLRTEEIRMLGGRLFPKIWTMEKTETPGQYTRMTYDELAFLDQLEDRLFSISNLKNFRR
ncbi:MAG: outer membrane lipoprotein-sorting protein [Deltaproteobacteria bacterium]|nr:outer membrane lipoprotein-sorting protein [Deltaproteobacteria bacterium]